MWTCRLLGYPDRTVTVTRLKSYIHYSEMTRAAGMIRRQGRWLDTPLDGSTGCRYMSATGTPFTNRVE